MCGVFRHFPDNNSNNTGRKYLFPSIVENLDMKREAMVGSNYYLKQTNLPLYSLLESSVAYVVLMFTAASRLRQEGPMICNNNNFLPLFYHIKAFFLGGKLPFISLQWPPLFLYHDKKPSSFLRRRRRALLLLSLTRQNNNEAAAVRDRKC